jgi:hypothetical protein
VSIDDLLDDVFGKKPPEEKKPAFIVRSQNVMLKKSVERLEKEVKAADTSKLRVIYTLLTNKHHRGKKDALVQEIIKHLKTNNSEGL